MLRLLISLGAKEFLRVVDGIGERTKRIGHIRENPYYGRGRLEEKTRVIPEQDRIAAA